MSGFYVCALSHPFSMIFNVLIKDRIFTPDFSYNVAYYQRVFLSSFQFPTPRAPVPIHNQKIVDWNKPETNGKWENGQKLC